MPGYARNASTWKLWKSVFAKHSGTWKLCVGVWAKASGSWSKLNGALTGASASGGNDLCIYFPPAENCYAETGCFAYPENGWAPFTYAWTVVSQDSGMSITNLNAQGCTVGGNVAHFGGKTATLYCTVTDATGTSKVTNTVNATLTGENGSF